MLNVSITTAEREVFSSNKITAITIPTREGEVTVLPGHVSLMSALGTGEIIIEDDMKSKSSLFVDGGLLQVLQDKVEILTHIAEKAEDLSEAKIAEAKRRAEKLLSEKPVDVDLAHVEATLKREIMKEKIITKYKPS